MANDTQQTPEIAPWDTPAPKEVAPWDTPAPAETTSAPSPTRALSKATTIKAQPPLFSKQWFKEKGFQGAFGTAEAMPAVGATVGGIAGGGSGGVPGAIFGAGLGQGGGEASRQLILRALGFPSPSTSTEAAKQIGIQSALGAGTQGLAEGVGPALSAVGINPAEWFQNWAKTQYYRALDPTRQINKAITEDITPELLKRRVWGTLGGLQKRAEATAAKLAPALDAEYAAYERTLPQGKMTGAGTQIINDLEKAKANYTEAGVVHEPGAVDALTAIQDRIKQHGPDISPSSLRHIRQIYDRPVAKAGGFAGVDLATQFALNSKEEAGNAIRDLLNSSPTNIGAMDKEISLWLDLQRVTKYSALNDVGQKGGLLRAIGEPIAILGTGVTGLAKGGIGTGVESATITALGALAFEVSRTAVWRTFTSVQKARIADAIASGSVENTILALGRTGMAALQARKDWPQAPSAGRNVTVSGPIPNSNSGGSTSAPPPTTPRAP